jgi:hypothetical protein
VADKHPDLTAEFRQSIEDYRAAGEASAYRPGLLEADKELQDQLQALGYLN